MEDSLLPKAAKSMQDKTAVFDKLREAMRIALPNGHCGLNDKGGASDIRPIEKAVEQFCRWVSADYLKIILDGAATLEFIYITKP